MWSPTKLMRIFEVLWIVAAIIALIIAILNVIRDAGSPEEYIYLFVITGLCIIMAMIKRSSRRFILKREAMSKQTDQ